MKNFIKKYRFVILTSLIVSILIYSPSFFGKEFSWYNDQAFQFRPFYVEWYEIIRESIKNMSFNTYSWNTFLGTDFFTSKLFYTVGDFILTPFFIIWPFGINIDIALTVETILCVVISAISMRIFLEKFGIEKKHILDTCSLIYAFSGFAMLFAGSYMFMRFYALLPLLFYFTEAYIQNKKVAGFSIVVALLFLQNFELMYSSSLFLIVYFIFSYFIKGEKKLSYILKNSLKLIATYFVGILLVGIALIPLILFLKTSTRVGKFTYDGITWNFNELYYFFVNVIYPPINFRSNVPAYPFYSYRYTGQEYSYFASSLFVFALYKLFKQVKEKKYFIIVELLLIIFAIIRPLNMIIHGFSEPTFRWTFLICFFNILLIGYVYDKYEDTQVGLSYILAVMLIVTVSFVYFMNRYGWFHTNNKRAIFLFMCYVFVLLIFYLLQKHRKLFYILAVIEMCGSYFFTVACAWYPASEIPSTFDKDELAYNKNNDSDVLFRYYFDSEDVAPYSILALNKGDEYGFMSTCTYDSAYDYVLHDFVVINEIPYWFVEFKDPSILKMLGVKYVGVNNNYSLIENVDNSYQYEIDGIKIYKIENYNHIAHTYSSFIKRSEFQNIDWNNQLIIEDADFDDFKDITISDKQQFKVTEANRKYFKGSINVDRKCALLISVPYSDGWKVLDQNGNKLKTYKVQTGFLGVIIDENVSEMFFSYTTPGLKTGFIISLVGGALLVFLIYSDKRIANKNKQ